MDMNIIRKFAETRPACSSEIKVLTKLCKEGEALSSSVTCKRHMSRLQEVCDAITKMYERSLQLQVLVMQISFACTMHRLVDEGTCALDDVMARLQENTRMLLDMKQREMARARSENNASSYMQMSLSAVICAYHRIHFSCCANAVAYDFCDVAQACKGVKNECVLRNAIVLGFALQVKRRMQSELESMSMREFVRALSDRLACTADTGDDLAMVSRLYEAVSSNLRLLLCKKRSSCAQRRAVTKHRLRVSQLQRSIEEKRRELAE